MLSLPLLYSGLPDLPWTACTVLGITVLSSNSSSPDALAHERWGVREYFHHRLTPLSSGCILLYTRVCRELVRVMAIFWTCWLVATNMTPFATTFHNRFQAAERMRETRVYAQEQLQLVLGSYFCQLDFSPFTVDQNASKLAVLVCSPLDCSCASTRSHPLPFGKFLATVCSRYFSLAAVQVSLASYRYCLFSFAFPAP